MAQHSTVLIHKKTVTTDASKIDEEIENVFSAMQDIISLGREARQKVNDNKGIGLKYPVGELIVAHGDAKLVAGLESVRSYIEQELNVAAADENLGHRGLILTSAVTEWSSMRALPDLSKLGRKLGKQMRPVTTAIKAMDDAARMKKRVSTGWSTWGDAIGRPGLHPWWIVHDKPEKHWRGITRSLVGSLNLSFFEREANSDRGEPRMRVWRVLWSP